MNFLSWVARSGCLTLLCHGLLPMGHAASLPTQFDLPAIDRYAESWVQEKGLVGLSIAIVQNGQIVHARGYGRTALNAHGQAVTSRTRFAIGSVSKQFTCAAVLLLAEEGKLSVHDKVARYFPHLTRASDITLLDLMNHTSGYPDYYPLDYVDQRMQKPITPEALLKQYAGGRLDFEPGSNYSYSNTGYILLGEIVEKVAGEKLGAFLRRRLFEPLGLTDTVYEPAMGTAGLAQGYSGFALSPPEPIAPEASGWIGAAGGIYSTPSDLARWNLALIGGRVLKAEMYKIMISPRNLTTGKISDYGCGLSVRQQNGRQLLSHNGAVAGFNAWNTTVPSTRSSVTVMCNLDGGLGALPGQILSLLLQETPNIPKVAAPSAPDTARRLFKALQANRVNRKEFSPDFNAYLTDDRLTGAAKRLRANGAPQSVDLVSSHERGGMEVSVCRLTFKKAPALRTLMYRQPNGIVEQFFVYKE
jgi:D-alanyl-D-alanine carboxypeptidase